MSDRIFSVGILDFGTERKGKEWNGYRKSLDDHGEMFGYLGCVGRRNVDILYVEII